MANKKVELSSDGECVCFSFVPSKEIVVELIDLVKKDWHVKDSEILRTEIFVDFSTSPEESFGTFGIWFSFDVYRDLYAIDQKDHNELYTKIIVEMLMVPKKLYEPK